MTTICAYLQSRIRNDSAATMVEYALILAAVALAVTATAVLLGLASNQQYTDVESCFENAASC